MTARIKAKLGDVELRPVEGEPFSLHVKGGAWDGALISFGRIYNYCQHAGAADCEASKAEFVTRGIKMPPKATPASLRLIVRDAEYVASARALPPGPDGRRETTIFEPIGDDLYALLASDSSDAIALITEKGLKELGMDRAHAWALAARQTRAQLPPLPNGTDLGKHAMAYQEQAYLASLLIDRDAWTKIAEAAGPELFVTVVSDDFVFVGTMPDGPQLEAFKKTVAEDCSQQQRCVSPHLYRFREGRWVVAK